MTLFRSKSLIALGSNLESEVGGSAQTLLSAVENMTQQGLAVRAVSRFFKTPSYPDPSAPAYVNAVVGVDSGLAPTELLALLHQIEARFGRIRQQRWGIRTLDLDLLTVDHKIAPNRDVFETWRDLPVSERLRAIPDQLILPHPRLQERAFVLVPMADIAPDWVHPVLGQSVTEMCAELPQADVAGVQPI